MIIREYAKCDSCNTVTILRLGIGTQDEQNFEYICENCNQEITGKLSLNQKEAKVVSLNLYGATLVDETDSRYIVTIHPDFPNISNQEDTFSPFISAAERHQSDFTNRLIQMAIWKKIIDNDAKNLKRIYKNYRQMKWEFFIKDVREYIPRDWPLERQIDKNRALYQILELCLMPIATSQNHVELIDNLTEFLLERKKIQFLDLINYLEKNKILEDIQDRAFKFTFQFFTLSKEMSSVIVEWDPQKPEARFPPDLVVPEKQSFDRIKSFYIDGYELVADSLTIILGLINLKHRGNFNSFAEHPKINKGKPFAKNLSDFMQKMNAGKLDLLFEEEKFEYWINSAMDPIIRNAIGHNDFIFDEKSEIIRYPMDKNKSQFCTIAYGDFLFTCIRILVQVHQINHLIKMLYVHLFLSKNKKEINNDEA